ncbi:MAG: MFS transporter [Pseudomonadota bacterium]
MSTLEASASQTHSAAYRLYVLVVLTAVYTFSFIDRQIIAILAPFIKDDLGLSDTQLGLLSGFAFAVLYTTLGIPIARLADRSNRVTIVAIALALWSGFTAISSVTSNFAQLALARVGVGIGEAGGSPPSHSLISDLYPKEKRAGALAIFALGIPIGTTLAYLSGGIILEHFTWRQTFLIVGLPGVLLALIVKLTIREPIRGANDSGVPDVFSTMAGLTPETGVERAAFRVTRAFSAKIKDRAFDEFAIFWRAAKHLLSIPSYRNVVTGLTAGSFASYGIAAWIVVYFSRAHPDFGIQNTLTSLGLINGTAYVAGVFIGGNLVDRMAAVSKSAYGTIPAIAIGLMGPIFVSAIWVDSPITAMILMWPTTLLLGFYLGPCFALAQTLAPVSIRALSTAIFFFILNMIALGFGPTYVGAASDIISGAFGQDTEMALRLAMSSLIIAGFISVWAFLQLRKSIDADWRAATETRG